MIKQVLTTIVLSIIFFAKIYAQAITPAQADTLIQNHFGDTNFIIIDVRSESEYLGNHVPNAINININSGTFSSDIDTLDKSKLYLLHCYGGSRSNSARNTMIAQGFTKVYDISGGITNWINSGYTATQNTSSSKIRILHCLEFEAAISQSSNPQIIDLRSLSTYNASHIIDSELYDTTLQDFINTHSNKTLHYFLYGNVINNSDSLLLYNLYATGYEQVYFLQDGFEQWKLEQLPYYENTTNIANRENSFLLKQFPSYIRIQNKSNKPLTVEIATLQSTILHKQISVSDIEIATNALPKGLYIVTIYTKYKKEHCIIKI